MPDPTSYSSADGVATITLDDGKVNALSISMLKALHADLDRAESEGALVVLSGRQGCFSAGFDLRVFREQPENILEMLLLGATFCERLLSFPRPVVVAATGHAIAAGGFVALSADLRIGIDGPFEVGLNEVRIGLTMPLFVVELARARLHPAHFHRAVVNAKMYEPAAAVEAGFLDEAAPAEEFLLRVQEGARDLAGLNADAYSATKERARGATLTAVRDAIDSELRNPA
jgi:enoyl-CoA hydratase